MTDKIFQTPHLFDVSCSSSDLSAFFPKNKPTGSKPGIVYFILTLKGNAFIEIDGTTWEIYPGIFIFIIPGHSLRQLACSSDFQYRYILFNFDFISDFPLHLKPEVAKIAEDIPCLHINYVTQKIFQQYYDLIYSRFHDSNIKIEVTKGLLFSFITEVSQLYSDLDKTTKSLRPKKLTDRFFALLHKHYKQERRALFYANKLCVSDKHLMRTVKEQTGYTIHDWITDFLLHEAKLLLKSTDKSVIEISEELKFPNSSFFARFFRKHVKMSPSEFRKRGD